ncbi:MAG: adenylate/guanylate cyclase domain-containing protein [Dehalococcoidia bacterium]
MASPPAVLEGLVAFTDIVGFTEFTAIQGDSAALELLDSQARIVEATLPEGARVVKELGDGLLLWFPEACPALEAALGLQRQFEAFSRAAEVPLWVRMGMHWGRQVPRGPDLVGHDVNLASRIADSAGPGEIVLSEATVTRIAGGVVGVEYEELGPVTMKGIPDPVWLYRAFRW